MLHRLSHNLTGYTLKNTFGFRSDEANSDQEIIVDRILKYYAYLKSEGERRNIQSINGVWSRYIDLFKDFIGSLDSRDMRSVSETLLKVCTTQLVVGFASFHNYLAIAKDPHANEFESYLTLDRLLSLAEFLGAANPQCPFQGPYGYTEIDIDGLLDRVRSRVPFDISAPKAGGGAFGLRTSDGIISLSEILAIHAATRANSILEDTDKKTVCEIGGGLGTLAYYMSKTCARSVIVGDLPIVSVIQGYYLMKSLGLDKVRLGSETGNAKINIIPYWELDEIQDKSISLFINIDSLPEIDENLAKHYVKLISRKGRDFFISVNQETKTGGQNVVQDLVEPTRKFRRLSRSPHWMLRGYVEELYRIE